MDIVLNDEHHGGEGEGKIFLDVERDEIGDVRLPKEVPHGDRGWREYAFEDEYTILHTREGIDIEKVVYPLGYAGEKEVEEVATLAQVTQTFGDLPRVPETVPAVTVTPGPPKVGSYLITVEVPDVGTMNHVLGALDDVDMLSETTVYSQEG